MRREQPKPNAQSGPISRRRVLQIVGRAIPALLLTPLLTGCPSRAEKLATITMTGQNAFAPASLIVSTGTKVVWKNGDTSPHSTTCDPAKVRGSMNVALPTGAPPWDSGVLYSGDVWAHTFDTPGTYVYFSAPDEDRGMIGTITVRG
jgi:plastocyanin